ncbi:MAG: heavy-metal-associated domain-containing protein [Gemmatimonadota bacterium]
MTGSTAPQLAGAHCAPASAPTTVDAAADAPAAGASERLDLTIAGMTCGHCVSAVREALHALPGVEVHHLRIGHVSLSLEPGTASPAAVIEAIREAGYQAGFTTSDAAQPNAGLPLAPAGGSCCSSR